MVTTIDSAGRLVIPSEIRREAGIQPDTPLEVRWRDGVIEIEPQPLPVTLEQRGRLTSEARRLLEVAPDAPFDCMLEAKQKDRALLQLREDLARRGIRESMASTRA